MLAGRSAHRCPRPVQPSQSAATVQAPSGRSKPDCRWGLGAHRSVVKKLLGKSRHHCRVVCQHNSNYRRFPGTFHVSSKYLRATRPVAAAVTVKSGHDYTFRRCEDRCPSLPCRFLGRTACGTVGRLLQRRGDPGYPRSQRHPWCCWLISVLPGPVIILHLLVGCNFSLALAGFHISPQLPLAMADVACVGLCYVAGGDDMSEAVGAALAQSICRVCQLDFGGPHQYACMHRTRTYQVIFGLYS